MTNRIQAYRNYISKTPSSSIQSYNKLYTNQFKSWDSSKQLKYQTKTEQKQKIRLKSHKLLIKMDKKNSNMLMAIPNPCFKTNFYTKQQRIAILQQIRKVNTKQIQICKEKRKHETTIIASNINKTSIGYSKSVFKRDTFKTKWKSVSKENFIAHLPSCQFFSLGRQFFCDGHGILQRINCHKFVSKNVLQRRFGDEISTTEILVLAMTFSSQKNGNFHAGSPPGPKTLGGIP